MNNKIPLPAGTVRGKSYEYGVRVNLAERGAQPNFIDIRRLFGYAPGHTPTKSNAMSYDDQGSANNAVDAWSHSHAFSTFVNRSRTTGEYLPEIEALRQRTLPTSIDEDAEIEIQFFHKPAKGAPNLKDAGQGFVTVTYQRGQTAPDGQTETWNWTLEGVGAYTPIENPFQGWPETVPLLVGATPTGASAGQQVTIRGTGFVDSSGNALVTGAAGVKIGGTNATGYTIVDTTKIVAILPAGNAGSAPIVVTNATGASTALPYTRGA
ncbi:MAG: IPT/TIG domain-containing protein [Microbacterium enclense]